MANPRQAKDLRPPRLGGVHEVAELLAISKSALADRRRSFGFPQPLAELRWRAAYLWENQPGRLERHLDRHPPRRR